MRQTLQRQIILEYLKENRTHPTAEDVFEALRKEYPNLTLATVYRTLNTLADHGIILRFKVNNKYHFDGFNELHLHFYCQKCNRIFDLESKELNKDINSIIKKIEKSGKTINEYHIVFYGICEECNKN
ncbi:MAG: Fur family transcriptional regulator, peroxide stress response regulator [Candidatus Woesearchaeota archaeon]|nr:Fur family transcriptional regulator, peroxide stress response regulator [Candidatus Woesearchaeota archaeon]MDN5327509.1 Fur family transcriptional regulator, peroxide stress response regulator [Candidatus Woesearchaeota archaeon]